MPIGKVWFITGANSGLGMAMAQHALERGDIVIATVRRPEDPNIVELKTQFGTEGRLHIMELDVTDKKKIEEVFEKVRNSIGRIDVVYNNAGFGAAGEIESTPDEFAREIFETNFWGAAGITKAAVRFFREVNVPPHGRLIQVSSMFGAAAGARRGYYSASKFALEGLTEALVEELDPEWNIKVTLLEAGYFRTQLAGKYAGRIPPHPAYEQSRRVAPSAPALVGDPAKLSRMVYLLSDLEEPPLRLLLGKDAQEKVQKKLKRMGSELDGHRACSDDLELEFSQEV